MFLDTATPARLEFRKPGTFSSLVLIGGLLGLFALSPLLAPGPMTSARAVAAALLGLTSALLIARAWPRERRVRVALDAGVIQSGDRTLPLASARSWALSSGGSTFEAAPFVSYRAELVLEGGERLVLIEDADPARVLSDLRRALGYLPLAVFSGWGLSPGAKPWLPRERVAVGDRTVSERGRPRDSELGAGLCVLGGAVVVGVAMGLMHLARIRRGAPTDLLSYALSGSLLAFIVVLGLFMVTDRVTAVLEGGRLVVERRALGVRFRRLEIAAQQLHGLWAVGLVPGEPRHLLIATADGLCAVRFFGEGAARAAARVSPQP